MRRDVFISYRSEDKSAAERVCASLEAENVMCWIAPRDIGAGEEWATAIVTGLRNCSCFVLILSSNSKNAKQISREAELADKTGLPIITFRIEDVEPPPALVYFLGNLQWLDAFGDRFDAAVARLVSVVRNQRPADQTKAETATPPAARSAPGGTASQPALARAEADVAPAAGSSSRPYIWLAAAVLLVGAGVAAWRFSRPAPPAPEPVNPAAAASAFGIEYMRTRDSGQLDRAYAMLGPLLQSNLDREKFAAAAERLQAAGKAVGYTAEESCTLRERGAYACNYRISYLGGQTKNDRLVIAEKNGGWAIAGDRVADR